MWIEIFKTGRHTDAGGASSDYDTDKLDKMAQTYNSRLADDPSQSAPLVKGHPKTDDPAFGWTERLSRKGDKLFAKMKDLSPQIIREIRQGFFKKISIALYPDLMLRHIGLLGAAQPAVKGLKPVAFEESSDFFSYEFYDYLHNADAEENAHSESDEEKGSLSEYAEKFSALKELNSKLDEENKKLREFIAISEKEARLKQFREFANSMIDNPDGFSIAPAYAEFVVDLLEMAHSADSVQRQNGEFSESSGFLPRIKSFLASLGHKPITKDLISSGENEEMRSSSNFYGKNVSPDRLNLHLKALDIRALEPELSYEEAVCRARKEYIIEI